MATPSPTASPAKPRPDFVSEAGRAIFRTRKGRPWLMEAFQVRYQDGQQKAELKDVDWTLNDEQGQALVRIKAPRATYRIEEERVLFEGQVEAWRYPTQDFLRSDKMEWAGKTGSLEGSGRVTWTRGKTRVQGDRALTNDRFERIEVEGNVQVQTVLEGDPLDSGG